MISHVYDSGEGILSFYYENVTHNVKVQSVDYEEYYNKKGNLHREDGPAVIDYRTDAEYYDYINNKGWTYIPRRPKNLNRGFFPRLEWHKNGKLHRENGPAVIVFQNEIGGAKCLEEWYLDGKPRNITGGPHSIEYDDKGEIASKKWLDENKKLHREDGPAEIDEKDVKIWHKHGKLHRRDGPAVENDIGDQIWYLNDKKHRLGDGPTQINFLNRWHS